MRISSLIILLFFSISLSSFGQDRDILKSLETKKAGEGTVTIRQDPRITALIGSPRIAGDGESTYSSGSAEKRTITSTGYRIQVYAGSGSRKGKEEALVKASQVKELLPNLPVYTYFAAPRWLCRVGDFRSIEEADAVMRKLRTSPNFKEVSIVKEKINIVY